MIKTYGLLIIFFIGLLCIIDDKLLKNIPKKKIDSLGI